MFYKWSLSGKYAEFIPVSKEDERRVRWGTFLGDPLPPLEQWGNPPLLTEYRGDGLKPRKSRKIGDTDGMYISEKARVALSDIWDKCALLYPVRIEEIADEPWYMVVPTIRLDCLDEEKSVLFRSSSTGKPYLVREWSLKEDMIGDIPLFCLNSPWMEPDNRDMYVSEYFKARVIESKLKGFCLKTSFLDYKPFVS